MDGNSGTSFHIFIHLEVLLCCYSQIWPDFIVAFFQCHLPTPVALWSPSWYCHNILLLLYHLSSQYPQLKYVISTNVCYQLLKITVFPLININIRIDGQYISKVKCIYRFYLDIYRIVQVLNVQRSYGHSVLVQIVFHFSGLSSTILSQILHNYVDCVESSRRPWGRPCQNSLC